MPTVLVTQGFYVRIRTNDHEPAHVHVSKVGGEARIALGLNGGTPRLLTVSKEMNSRDAATALRLVIEHNEELLTQWREVHE